MEVCVVVELLESLGGRRAGGRRERQTRKESKWVRESGQ